MIIGERLRSIKESKNFSQGEIEKRTGLLRCYISRVENGHTVPALETLEKFAHAMEIPVYQLFYDGQDATPLKVPLSTGVGHKPTTKEFRLAEQISNLVGRMRSRDQKLLLHMARKMVHG
jgi:transcriptional regulator with XRE-family HTH domain